MNPNINPANAVTASRFLCLPPFLWAVDAGHGDVAAMIVVGCGLLDKLDGIAAKVFDCKTPFGSLFDAIADAVCYGFFMVVLGAYAWVPLPAVVALLALGVGNTLLRGAYARRAGKAVNFRSFAMERVVAYYAYLAAFGCAGYMVPYFYWGCVAVTSVVVLHDAKRMLVDPVPA